MASVLIVMTVLYSTPACSSRGESISGHIIDLSEETMTICTFQGATAMVQLPVPTHLTGVTHAHLMEHAQQQWPVKVELARGVVTTVQDIKSDQVESECVQNTSSPSEA